VTSTNTSHRIVSTVAVIVAAVTVLVAAPTSAGAIEGPARYRDQPADHRTPSHVDTHLRVTSRATPILTRTLTVRTVPPIPRVTFRFLDRTFVTDAAGIATLDITVEERNALARHRASVLSVATPIVRLDATHRANFAGWSGKGTYRWSPSDPVGATETATFRTDRLVSFHFTDQHGAPVATNRIQRFEVRSNTGAIERFAPGTPHWLASTEVVLGPGGPTERKRSYSVVTAQVQRSNLVNAGQQRFTPADHAAVTVTLLFFRVTFHASDAIFGASSNGRMVLTYPDDSTRTVTLRNGRVTLAGLPRGLYQIAIRGPGPTSTRPVTISSGTTIQLAVVTWRDLGTGAALLVGAALFVLLAAILLRRRHARRGASGPSVPTPQPTQDEHVPVEVLT
jgi:hypothetical protein